MDSVISKHTKQADKLGWIITSHKVADFGRTFSHKGIKYDSLVKYEKNSIEYFAFFNGDLGFYLNYRYALKNGYVSCDKCGGSGIETIGMSNRNTTCSKCGGYKITSNT